MHVKLDIELVLSEAKMDDKDVNIDSETSVIPTSVNYFVLNRFSISVSHDYNIMAMSFIKSMGLNKR